MNQNHPAFEFYIRGQFFGGVEDIPEDAPKRLLALSRFDHPQLKAHTATVTEAKANQHVQRRIGKSCAGLNPHYRYTGGELREAIRRGTLAQKESLCLNWTLSGMRSWQLHELYTRWRLSIYELARMVEQTYKGRHALSRWLNLWGETPERPLPEDDGLTRAERARGRGYKIDSRITVHLLVMGAPRSECRVRTWGSIPCLRQVCSINVAARAEFSRSATIQPTT